MLGCTWLRILLVAIRKSIGMTFNDDFDHINIVKCNKVMGTSYFKHLKINKRAAYDARFEMWTILYHICYVMSGYGFVRTLRQTAHIYFCLNQALIAYFFTLNVKNNMYMNKQMKQSGLFNHKDDDLRPPPLSPLLGDCFVGKRGGGSSGDKTYS